MSKERAAKIAELARRVEPRRQELRLGLVASSNSRQGGTTAQKKAAGRKGGRATANQELTTRPAPAGLAPSMSRRDVAARRGDARAAAADVRRRPPTSTTPRGPSIREELFDDLVELAGLAPGARLLEIGCATGKATRPMLERGFAVVVRRAGRAARGEGAPEPRRPAGEIDVAAVRDVAGRAGSFDLVFAATAWHWVDPACVTRRRTGCSGPPGTSRSGARCTRSPRASIPSSPRSRRCTTRSARATAASGRRRRRRRRRRRGRDRGERLLRRRARAALRLGAAIHRGRVRRAARHLLGPHRDGAGKRERLYAEIRKRIAARRRACGGTGSRSSTSRGAGPSSATHPEGPWHSNANSGKS